jgi:hypothetical protein
VTFSVKKRCKGKLNIKVALNVDCLILILILFSDDLRTANIICDSPDGVTCLVIDRETFNIISNLDEIKNRYNDEINTERRR